MIFLDIEMPEMDGYETLEKIKESHDIPVVFMTDNENIDVQKAAESGIAFVTKVL